MTLLRFQVPNCGPQLMFSDRELAFRRDYAGRYSLRAPNWPDVAVSPVAHPGGYRIRKHDPDPGNQTMRHRQTRLTSVALAMKSVVKSWFGSARGTYILNRSSLKFRPNWPIGSPTSDTTL